MQRGNYSVLKSINASPADSGSGNDAVSTQNFDNISVTPSVPANALASPGVQLSGLTPGTDTYDAGVKKNLVGAIRDNDPDMVRNFAGRLAKPTDVTKYIEMAASYQSGASMAALYDVAKDNVAKGAMPQKALQDGLNEAYFQESRYSFGQNNGTSINQVAIDLRHMGAQMPQDRLTQASAQDRKNAEAFDRIVQHKDAASAARAPESVAPPQTTGGEGSTVIRLCVPDPKVLSVRIENSTIVQRRCPKPPGP